MSGNADAVAVQKRGDKEAERLARFHAQIESVPLSLKQWAEQEIEPKRFLLGKVFSTTTRALLSADTGLGKTHFGFAVGLAMAAGEGFCHWRGCGGAPRVLVIDGEMSAELVQERLADVERRLGRRPEGFFCLCRDTIDMPPLDTEEGVQFLGDLIAHLGGVHFIIFDNLGSLTIGNLVEPESWQPMIPLNQSLTKSRIGILWINHTGHDKTRDYGPRMRLWQMDTAMVAQKIEDAEADIAFLLEFPKARQRKPSNRADFEAVEIRLSGDTWNSTPPERKKLNWKRPPRGYLRANEVLTNVLVDAETMVPRRDHVAVKAISLKTWREALVSEGLLETTSVGAITSRGRSALSAWKTYGIRVGEIQVWRDWIWRP